MENLEVTQEEHTEKDAEENSGTPIKIRIPKENRHKNYNLFDLKFSDGSYAGTMSWSGMSEDGKKEIMQPCIQILNTGAASLSFDGTVHYNGGIQNMALPCCGGIYTVGISNQYYFDRINPLIHNELYNLSFNNMSIRMNNVSLFSEAFYKGVMFDFRASMEGTFIDEEKTGQIVVLASILTIN